MIWWHVFRWPQMDKPFPKPTQTARKDTDSGGLKWAERCELLRSNPITAARTFDYRSHIFLNEVLMSPLQRIGKIKDYFYCTEFQQRGSPHVHRLLGLKMHLNWTKTQMKRWTAIWRWFFIGHCDICATTYKNTCQNMHKEKHHLLF